MEDVAGGEEHNVSKLPVIFLFIFPSPELAEVIISAGSSQSVRILNSNDKQLRNNLATPVLITDHDLLPDGDEASPLDIDEDPRGDIVSGLHLPLRGQEAGPS